MSIIRTMEDPIQLGDGQYLTMTEQYSVTKKWYIGYNSNWDDNQYCTRHSFFMDCDGIDLDKAEMMFYDLFDYYCHLTGNEVGFLGFLLQSSKQCFHLFSPQLYDWTDVLALLGYYTTRYKNDNIKGYGINCMARGYNTLRLSKKHGNRIKVVKYYYSKGAKKPFINNNHLNIIKGFLLASDNIKDRQLKVMLDKRHKEFWIAPNVTNKLFETYSDK